jgi:hypothetical protein
MDPERVEVTLTCIGENHLVEIQAWEFNVVSREKKRMLLQSPGNARAVGPTTRVAGLLFARVT